MFGGPVVVMFLTRRSCQAFRVVGVFTAVVNGVLHSQGRTRPLRVLQQRYLELLEWSRVRRGCADRLGCTLPPQGSNSRTATSFITCRKQLDVHGAITAFPKCNSGLRLMWREWWFPAGAVAAVVTTPMDVAKTRLMTQAPGTRQVR